jgi:hypothetical protein
VKQILLITQTANGKRLRAIDPAELDSLIEDGEVEHYKGNVYQTKVMRADMRESCIGQKLDKLTAMEEASDPPKRKRGRPRKDAA